MNYAKNIKKILSVLIFLVFVVLALSSCSNKNEPTVTNNLTNDVLLNALQKSAELEKKSDEVLARVGADEKEKTSDEYYDYAKFLRDECVAASPELAYCVAKYKMDSSLCDKTLDSDRGLCVAESTKNSEACNLIEDFDVKMLCSARLNNDVLFCGRIENSEKSAGCKAEISKNAGYCKEISNGSERTICNAVAGRDAMMCTQLPSQEAAGCFTAIGGNKEFCSKKAEASCPSTEDIVTALAFKNNKQLLCLSKELGQSSQERCLRDFDFKAIWLALKEGKIEMCTNISDSYLRGICFNNSKKVWLENIPIEQKVAVCKKIGNPDMSLECFGEVDRELVHNNNTTAESCEELFLAGSKDNCFFDFAVNKNLPGVCEKINSSTMKSACTAVIYGDLGACKNIGNDDLKTTCLAMIAEKRANSSICEELDDARKKECLDYLKG